MAKGHLVLLWTILILLPSFADTLIVDPNDAFDYTEIWSAILNANDGDTVLVRPGLYTEDFSFYGKSITVRSLDPNDMDIVQNTIISPTGQYSVHFDWLEDPNAVLTGFSIIGKGIRCYGSSPTIKKNLITFCSGPAINCSLDASPTIKSNVITYISGDAIIGCNGIIQDNIISDNDANALNSCVGWILENDIYDNNSIALVNCSGTISGNVINNNKTGLNDCNGNIFYNEIYDHSHGGMISCSGYIFNNQISSNLTYGGLHECSGTIENNEITGNQAANGAGLYQCSESGTTIVNNTIVGNIAENTGGAVYQCNVIFKNNILAYNKAANIGGIYGQCQNSYNCFWASSGGDFGGGAVPDSNDFIANPQFASNGIWENNVWTDGDYHLKSKAARWDPFDEKWVKDDIHSPCIDTGDPDSPTSFEGFPNGDRINIGAWGGTEEASKSQNGQTTTCSSSIHEDITEDCRVNFLDLQKISDRWLDSTSLISSGSTYSWGIPYDGAGGGDDQAVDIVIDSTGAVYICGSSKSINNDYDIVLIKYDAEGNEQWDLSLGEISKDDMAADMEVDTDDNIIIIGKSKNANNNYDFLTVKYDPNGTEMWAMRFLDNDSYDQEALAVALDSNNNVYVTGRSKNASNNWDITTLKYDVNGNEKWSKTKAGTGNGNDFPADIAVDSENNIYVTGTARNTTNDFITIKYSSSGLQHWFVTTDGPGFSHDSANAIGIDNDNNVYVTGSTFTSANNYDYLTIKYNPINGDIDWDELYDGPANDDDYPYALTIDKWDNVYVTGESTGVGTGRDFATIKYDPSDGTYVWIARYNGPEDDTDYAQDVLVDSLGYTYTAGSSINTSDNYDFAVFKTDPNGTVDDIIRYDGPAHGSDLAVRIAQNNQDVLYITGQRENAGGNSDFFTLKYLQEYNCYEDIREDLNSDCRVDVFDLLMMALSWLDCNIEPEEACWWSF